MSVDDESTMGTGWGSSNLDWMRRGSDTAGPFPPPAGHGQVFSPGHRAPEGPAPAGGRRGPVPRSGAACVEGQARGIQTRSEASDNGDAVTVWAFRIERYDSAGNRLPPVAVEMRARGFEGSLSEGDEVRVAGSWKDGTIRAERIENLTTNSLVRKRRFPWKGLVIFLVLAFVLVAAFMVLGTVMSASDHQNWCDSARDAGIRPASC